MKKSTEANKDSAVRGDGRVRSKGAAAAERASAGLGATDHDAELLAELLPTRPWRSRPVTKGPEPDKR